MSDHHDEFPKLEPEEGPDPTLEDPAMRALAGGPTAPLKLKQPQGLWVLFITEMWERFSYYGMRALLVLYLIASTSEALESGEINVNPGFGWSEESAYTLYGIYTWLVYLTPIFGGLLADRLLGTHRSMLIGGWIIAAGHITLALTELSGYTVGEAVTLQTGPGALLTFMGGLALIVIGTGFFKPCVSVMVGQLYEENDPRRDSGFTIFYMGINLGAFFSPLVAGTLGEKIGWHWGFGSAAVGMLCGLFFYQMFRPKYLQGVGLPPKQQAEWDAEHRVKHEDPESGEETQEKGPLSSIEWQRIWVILILAFLGNIFFWTAFEQAGSSLNVFAKNSTDRTFWGMLGGEGFPASWYQSVNPLAILIFAPVFAWLWMFLDRKKLNPSTPAKFFWGLFLLGLAFIAMIFGAMESRDGGLAGPHWLLITYVVCTWGELCLSPVGLSMVTKLSPARLQSLMMGLWFFSFSMANLFGGLVARFSTKVASGEVRFFIDGLPGFFLMLVVFPIGAGVLILILSPLLKRMMHGVK
ncbi:MAG: peptide MFS transporter [Planctomycetota bacterium]|jgi:POT family proton-dependent oligopeptide transporter